MPRRGSFILAATTVILLFMGPLRIRQTPPILRLQPQHLRANNPVASSLNPFVALAQEPSWKTMAQLLHSIDHEATA